MKTNFLMLFFILAFVLIMTGYSPINKHPLKNDSSEKSELNTPEKDLAAAKELSGNNTGKEINILEESILNDGYHDPGLQKVVQVAIVVKDIEASSKRWAELLGMAVPEIRTTRPGHEVKEIYRGKPSEGQVKLTFFNLGQVVLELLQPISEGTSWKEFLDEKGEGVQHLGFQVVDPDKTSRELENAGYPIFHQGRYDSDDGTYIYHETLDDLGVVIELLHSDARK